MSDLLTQIVKEYAPYDTHEAFAEGLAAYQRVQRSDCKNPYDDGNLDVALSEEGQAWERGFEAAVRYRLATEGYKR